MCSRLVFNQTIGDLSSLNCRLDENDGINTWQKLISTLNNPCSGTMRRDTLCILAKAPNHRNHQYYHFAQQMLPAQAPVSN